MGFRRKNYVCARIIYKLCYNLKISSAPLIEILIRRSKGMYINGMELYGDYNNVQEPLTDL